jgi:hypothetical protein
MGYLCFLVLVFSLPPAWSHNCVGQAGVDQHKRVINATRMDDTRHSEVTSLQPEKNATEQTGPEDNLFEIMGAHGRIMGVIDWAGKTRVYIQPAGEDTVYAFDSEDLRTWKRYEKPDFPTAMALIQVDESVYGYTEEGSSAYLWNEFDPDKGCQNKLGKMYEWKLDGTLAPTHTEKGWIQLGRVRGYRSQNEGGWGDERVKHPEIQDFPQVKKAFEGTSYDAKDWLQDRRGVSLHTSEDGDRWKSRILLAPENVNLPGFRGWKERDANGIADFYSAVMIDSKRAFVKVYWKTKDRLIDRTVYTPDIDVRRRFRFTGETTFVPAVLEDGELKITSTKSVIPKNLHARVVTKKQVPWVTNPGVPEVGQLTPHNRVIIRNGHAHIFYCYRDDIHYEGGWESQNESVNVYRVDKEDFDRLFE